MRQHHARGARTGRGLPHLRTGQVQRRRVVGRADERRLGQQQVGLLRDRVEPRTRAGVAAVGQHPVTDLHAEGVGLDRVVDGVRRHRERPDLDRVLLRTQPVEHELLAHARLLGQVVGPRQTPRCAPRPPHRQRLLLAGGVVLAQHVVAGHVDAVVGVQVREEHRVDVEGVDVAVQRSQRAVAEVHQDVPGAALVLGLHQVARRRRVRARVGPAAPHDRQLHAHPSPPATRPPANWLAAIISGPRNRRPIASNSCGAPVVRKVYVASPPSRIRSVVASIL